MSVLDELVAGALEDQRTRELTVSLEDVKKAALAAPAPIDATRWLKRADGIPVIAEIKRVSVQGPPVRHPGPGRAGPRVREGRRKRHLRAHRRPQIPRQP